MQNACTTALIASLALLEPTTATADRRLATSTLTASAQVSTRAAVQVSSDVLVFHVSDAAVPAEATVTFTAGARTPPGSEVRLVVSYELPASLTMTGFDGTRHTVMSNGPTVVSRWTGGGLRRGEIRFQLHAAPGTYTIPARFFLNVP